MLNEMHVSKCERHPFERVTAPHFCFHVKGTRMGRSVKFFSARKAHGVEKFALRFFWGF